MSTPDPRATDAGPRRRSVLVAGVASVLSGAAVGLHRYGDVPDQTESMTRLLAAADAALLARDGAAWSAVVGEEVGRPSSLAAVQVAARLGVSGLRREQPRIRDGVLESVLWYRCEGFDEAQTSALETWSLTRDGTRLVRGTVPPGPPWAWASTSVRRDGMLLAVADRAISVDELAQTAARGIAAVAACWGGEPVRPVILAPGTVRDYAALAGRSSVADSAHDAATTIGEVLDSRAVGAQRVIVNPQAWGGLIPAGRDSVLAHELTHLALRRDTQGTRPAWLTEGFCEYIAFRSSTLPTARLSEALLEQVRRHGAPEALPSDADFEMAQVMPSAYAGALVACRLLARLAGEPALVAVVRRAGSAAIAEVLPQVTSLALPELTRSWRTEVTRLAGQPEGPS